MYCIMDFRMSSFIYFCTAQYTRKIQDRKILMHYVYQNLTREIKIF